MDISELPPDQAATLITQILNDKDPASVGVSRILRRKTVEAEAFPMRAPAIEEFSAPGNAKKLLTEGDRRIAELERQATGLKEEHAKQAAHARQAVENAYKQGFDEGRAKGLAQGKSEAGSDYQKKIEAVQAATGAYLKILDEAKRTIYSDADRVMLELCRRMVTKILSAELTQRPDAILGVLRKALSYVAEREKLVIRVSPGDIETVSGNKDFWVPVTEQLTAISIEPDERIEKGGCIVESNSGIVDARLDVQQKELAELIDKAWESTYAETDSQEAVRG